MFGFMWCLVVSPKQTYAMETISEIVSKLQSHAWVYGTAISAPLGRYLLLRKDNYNCALKFTSFSEKDIPDKGLWHFADYEWFCSDKVDGKFTGATILKGGGKLDKGPMKQFWRFISFPGDHQILCGDFELSWALPAGIALTKGFSLKGIGIEVAPTRWENATDVDFSNQTLKWYFYGDPHNEPKEGYIPLDKLPPQDKK